MYMTNSSTYGSFSSKHIYSFNFLFHITFSVTAIPVPGAIFTMRHSEQLGLPMLLPAAKLTFYIIVAFLNLSHKLNFNIFDFPCICTFSQKMFSHTTLVLNCVDITLMYPKSTLQIILISKSNILLL